MLFVNVGLARRLESVAASVSAECASACGEHFAELHPGALKIGTGVAVFAGADSPLTHAVGLGMLGQVFPTEIDKLETFFEERGANPRVWLCPFADPSLIETLGARGYRLSRFQNVLVRAIDAPAPLTNLSPEVIVERAAPDEAGLWAKTIVEASEDGPGTTAQVAMTLFHRPSSAEFLARIGDEVIAAASVHVHDGVAFLSSAATLKPFRGRGAHGALLQARLAYAAEHGCDLALASTAPGAPSQRNAERAGFRVIYTKVAVVGPSDAGRS